MTFSSPVDVEKDISFVATSLPRYLFFLHFHNISGEDGAEIKNLKYSIIFHHIPVAHAVEILSMFASLYRYLFKTQLWNLG